MQIVGIAVLSGDSSIISHDMYKDNITFEDVIKLYNKYPNFADPYTGIFNYKPDLFYIWIKSIIKHHLSYLNHIFNYSKDYLTTKSGFINSKYISWKLSSNSIQSKNKPFDFYLISKCKYQISSEGHFCLYSHKFFNKYKNKILITPNYIDKKY